MANLSDFSQYKSLIDTDISEHSQRLLDRWGEKFSQETITVLESYLDILARGGKRLRGSLVMWAYGTAGGDDHTLSIKVARLVEMLHAYLLVIDDVADEAQTRRGGPAAHIVLKKFHESQKWRGDASHFGAMQAINAACGLQHVVTQELSELPLNDSVKLELLREISSILFKTGIGQIVDINQQAMQAGSEAEIIAMMKQKTAYYSFVSPLQAGVIAADKDWSNFEWLETWAVPAGLSFQITDDILGVFGDNKVTGKDNLDDLREGKMTLIVVRVLENAKENDKQSLLAILGNPRITSNDLETAQAIIQNSGALAYATGKAEHYANKAQEALNHAPDNMQAASDFLRQLSRSLLQRST